MKKKIFKVIGIILLVLIAVFLIHIIRNYVIVRGLQKNIEKYKTSSSYHIKMQTSLNGKNTLKLDYYSKGERQVLILNKTTDDSNTKISMYNNGERIDTFIDAGDSKQVILNSSSLMDITINNNLETDNNWQTFISCFFAKIKKEEINGKTCYMIKGYMSPSFLNGKNKNEVYVEKDTGLLIKSVNDTEINEREYEFNNVDDSIFTEPDIGQYKIKENNNE